MRKLVLFLSLLIFGLFTVSLAIDKNENSELPTLNNKAEKISLEKGVFKINSYVAAEDGFPGGIIWSEDFEPGGPWNRWTAVDLTDPPPEPGPPHWLVDSWEALGDSSWRMADTTLGNYGGYDNHWYQVMDTPPILLNDTSAIFTFYHRYYIEDPAGVDDPDYDGWDGCNVRISLDSGATWQVLPAATYNVTSNWAFGHPQQGHNEGPGIPSWAGEQSTWTKETFDLSEYTSADTAIMLRFAFASDLAYSTADGDADMFGWQIDSIIVSSPDSIFFKNYGTTEDLAGSSIEFIPPVGGNLWHIAEIVDQLEVAYPEATPTPTHAAVCQNGGDLFSLDSTYNPYMDNVFVTGPISLPEMPDSIAEIYLDFKLLPFFADVDQDLSSTDYWWADIRHIDSTDWVAVWREWISGTLYNIVSNDGDDKWWEWGSFSGWPVNSSPYDISAYAGQDVYIRFRFTSDEDAPIGSGLMIDDVIIYSPIKEVLIPENLVATSSPEDTTIVLKWDYVEGSVYQVWRTTPGDQYIHLIGEVIDSGYVDEDVEPFQEYYYRIKACVKYEGTSDFSDWVVSEVIPLGIIELSYDDSMIDTTVVPAPNKIAVVKFTPDAYPVDLKGLNICLDKTGTTSTAAQFTVWDDDGEDGSPGTQLFFINKSGLYEGFNRLIFEDSIAIDSGSFYIGHKRFGNSLKLGADTNAVIDGNTYVQTDTGWVQITDMDGMIHAVIDTSRAIPPVGIDDLKALVADEFILGRNYPNPFNPVTTIPFVVPTNSAGKIIKLDIYNVLGQKVITLFDGKAKAGLNTVRWNGLNRTGKAVGSGIYLYQLSGDNIQLTKRMLLIK